MTLIHQSVPFQVSNVIEDKFGRYLIVQGSLLSINLNLVNIYGPDTDEHSFFTNVLLTLASLPGKYIIAGDWNCMLDPVRDRSTGIDQTHNRSRTTIHHFIKELNLLDIWRHFKPNDVAYSCYSSTYQTYSRIAYFLISASLVSKIQDCCCGNILISDHGQCCMIYTVKNLIRDPPRWTLSQKWLQDDDFVKYVGTEKRQQLQSRIHILPEQVFRNKAPEAEKELLLLSVQYNKLSAARAASSMLGLNQTFYEQGGKPSKILAWQIKQLEIRKNITYIINNNGDTIIDPAEINWELTEYYENLYKSQIKYDPQVQKTFLDKLDIPTISEEFA